MSEKSLSSPLAALWARLSPLMLHDRQRLKRRLQQASKAKSWVVQQQIVAEASQQITDAEQRIARRLAGAPVVTFPEHLPVSEKKELIADIIDKHQVVIVAGETGSGKTTQLPKICMALGRGIQGLIGHTQPRRLAACSVANRIAEELGTQLGECIGYKVRFSDKLGENTQVKLMTDGILLAEIQQDRLLMQYDTIIIDEAHERSLNIDFLLGYLHNLLPQRTDLKVIITSATIDPARFSSHFNQAPVIEVSGRTFPVDVRYRPVGAGHNENEQDALQAIFDAIDELGKESFDDILIFMSGEREIRDMADALNKRQLPHTEVLPLYARLSNTEQRRVFQPHGGRRIVLATNVAETSLTVPSIKYVIDPGNARISRYSYRTKVQRLPIEPISQAAANQRKGRCGRVSAGICIRLYSQEEFNQRPPFTDAEILRTNLASVILQMMVLGLGDINAFPFIEAPDKRNIRDGIQLLEELGAISQPNDKGYQLTAMGRQLGKLPVDPRLARMILAAQQQDAVHEMMIITAALSIQDPRERPADKQQAADEKHRRFVDKNSDFITFIQLWNYLGEQQKMHSASQFRRQCKQDFLNYLRVREWQDVYTQLRQSVRELGIKINSKAAEYRQIHLAILSGLLSHIGQKVVDKSEYLGARQIQFAIFPASGLFKKPPPWIMVAELVETRRLWGRIAACIEPEWIEPFAQHLLKRSYSEPHWEKSLGAVMAKEKVTLYGLPIVVARSVNYGVIDAPLSRELFIRHALVEGEWQTHYPFFSANLKLRNEVEELEHKSRRRDILVDDETLFHFYDQRIGDDVVSARHFDSWWQSVQKETPELLDFSQEMLIQEGSNTVSKQDYPDFWYQDNLALPISYQFLPGSNADGVMVSIPLVLLNQIKTVGFEWQIPGLRSELIVALIKSLPKTLRRHFVPAPNYAEAFLNDAEPLQTPLLNALEQKFRRMSGVTIERQAWQWDQVPDHLKITFRVVDENHHLLKEGKDLTALRAQLKDKVQQSLTRVAEQGVEKSGLQQWDFGNLPSHFEQQRGHYRVKAWPALVDEKESVAIRLFDSPQEQQKMMWGGQRRLLRLNAPSPIKYLHNKLTNNTKLAFYFNSYGKVLDLIDDCITCALDQIIDQFGGPVWQQADFHRLQHSVRAELNDSVMAIAGLTEQILLAGFNLNKRLKGRVDMALALALSDIKTQINRLIYPGFLTETGWKRLPDTLRYLQAIERRLEKLPQDPLRDRGQMLKIEQVEQARQCWFHQLPLARRDDKEVQDIYWMVEELRVSCFAQQLGTPYPVSEKRILQAMALISL